MYLFSLITLLSLFVFSSTTQAAPWFYKPSSSSSYSYPTMTIKTSWGCSLPPIPRPAQPATSPERVSTQQQPVTLILPAMHSLLGTQSVMTRGSGPNQADTLCLLALDMQSLLVLRPGRLHHQSLTGECMREQREHVSVERVQVNDCGCERDWMSRRRRNGWRSNILRSVDE